LIRRPPTLSRNGMIAASHPLAAEAGVSVLREGGHAVDALIAAGAVLSVVEPSASGLGGDAFFLISDRSEGGVTAVNGSGKAPRALTRDRYSELAGVPIRDAASLTTPGCVAAWSDARDRWGRLSWRRLLQPAVALAKEGYPVSWRMGRILHRLRDVVARDPGLSRTYLRPDGRPLVAGEICRPGELGRTLELLSQEGVGTFYSGSIAERLCEGVKAAGGALSVEDLEAHRSRFTSPYLLPLGRLTVHEQPLPSQGVLLLIMLGISGAEVGERTPEPSSELHRQVQSKKIAFVLKEAFLTDPDWLPVPETELVEALLDPPLLRALAKLAEEEPLRPELAAEVVVGVAERSSEKARSLIGRYRAAGFEPARAIPFRPSGLDTTYLCAADRDGNLAGLIQSIFHPFGSGFQEPSTGILLNNRAVGFSLDPVHVNRLEPGKRSLHTLNSYLIHRDGRPWLVGGTPGGDNQVQTNLQIIRNLLAGGTCWPGPLPQVAQKWTQAREPRSVRAGLPLPDALARALEAPRWRVEPDGRVWMESRFPAEVRRRLWRIGHESVRLGPWEGSGFVQVIAQADPVQDLGAPGSGGAPDAERTAEAGSGGSPNAGSAAEPRSGRPVDPAHVYIGATDPRGEGVALGL
jgi:gamma-glutamyltranspeptidase